MAFRLITLSSTRPLPALRLWRDPSWPVGEAPIGAWAVEWCRSQPGHPSSYALLGVHDGLEIATKTHVGIPFEGSLAGAADDVRFGLPNEFRGAVEEALAGTELSPCLAAHGMAGSSIIAFRTVATFIRDLDESMWLASDDHVTEVWDRAVHAARPGTA